MRAAQRRPIGRAMPAAPRGHFQRTQPQVSLNLGRYQHAHDFATPHEFDAAIQYG